MHRTVGKHAEHGCVVRIGEPCVGKRLKLRRVDAELRRLGLRPASVLDAGAEDATFVYWLADLYPDATIIGLDIDAEANCGVSGAAQPDSYKTRVIFELGSFSRLEANAFDLHHCLRCARTHRGRRRGSCRSGARSASRRDTPRARAARPVANVVGSRTPSRRRGGVAHQSGTCPPGVQSHRVVAIAVRGRSDGRGHPRRGLAGGALSLTLSTRCWSILLHCGCSRYR